MILNTLANEKLNIIFDEAINTDQKWNIAVFKKLNTIANKNINTNKKQNIAPNK